MKISGPIAPVLASLNPRSVWDRHASSLLEFKPSGTFFGNFSLAGTNDLNGAILSISVAPEDQLLNPRIISPMTFLARLEDSWISP